jgi:hypothetical protein
MLVVGGEVERTFSALVVLECLEAGEGCSAGDNLMAKAGLVLLKVFVVVDTVVGVFRVVPSE